MDVRNPYGTVVSDCPPVSFGPGGFYIFGAYMADKIYKSYRQQLNILRSRGMVIGKGWMTMDFSRISISFSFYSSLNTHSFNGASNTIFPVNTVGKE